MALTSLSPLGVSGRRYSFAPASGVYDETVTLAASASVAQSGAVPGASITWNTRNVFVEIAPAPGKWEALVAGDNPSGWWRFGKPGNFGELIDETANENHATRNGGPANFVNVSKIATHCGEDDNRASSLNLTFNYFNRYEGAFNLDGTDDYWNAPDDAALDMGTGDFSLEVFAWWSAVSGGHSGWRYLLWKGGVSSAGYYLRFNYDTDDLQFGIHDGTNSATATWAASTVRDRSRHNLGVGDGQHIVCEKVGATIRLIVNSVEHESVSAAAVTGSLDNADDLHFGADGTPGNYFADFLDEVVIYRGAQALTAAEIDAHYASTRWIYIEEDVIRERGFRIRSGKKGGSPTDLVASPGLAVFTVDNSTQNLAGTAGYYSPGHPDALTDFGDGTRIRIGIASGNITEWVFGGAVKTLEPSSDPREPMTTITAGDFFYDALEERLTRVPAYEGEIASDIFEQLVASMQSRPVALRTYPSDDIYPIVFDDLAEESTSYLRALQALAQSDYAHMYVMPMDSLNGEAPVVVFEPRSERLHDRVGDLVGSVTTKEMRSMISTREKANIINHVDVTYRRREVGTTEVVVARLREAAPGEDPATAIPIAAGDTYLFHIPYTNPLDRQQRIGAREVQAPVATTDYQFFASPEGTGIDLTGSLTVVSAEIGVTSVALEVRNDAATLGHLTRFDVRGVTVIADEPTTVEQVDAGSVALNGERPLTPPFSMPYQPNGLRPSGLASYIRLLWANQFTDVKSITIPYLAAISTLGTPYFFHPGVRIDIVDVQAGIDQRFFIQDADIEIVTEAEAWVTFGLMPSHPQRGAFTLDDASFAFLETTTELGYF